MHKQLMDTDKASGIWVKIEDGKPVSFDAREAKRLYCLETIEMMIYVQFGVRTECELDGKISYFQTFSDNQVMGSEARSLKEIKQTLPEVFNNLVGKVTRAGWLFDDIIFGVDENPIEATFNNCRLLSTGQLLGYSSYRIRSSELRTEKPVFRGVYS